MVNAHHINYSNHSVERNTSVNARRSQIHKLFPFARKVFHDWNEASVVGALRDTQKTLTCAPSRHRKAWCERWPLPCSRSWHSWWRLCPPVPPRAQWGWNEHRHTATWRRTPHRAPGDTRLLRGERKKSVMRPQTHRNKEENWDKMLSC